MRKQLALLGALCALVPGAAFGYALNAHVAICQHVLDGMTAPQLVAKSGAPDLTPRGANVHDNRTPDPAKGVVAGRAGSGAMSPPAPSSEIARIVLAHPAQFRAGC